MAWLFRVYVTDKIWIILVHKHYTLCPKEAKTHNSARYIMLPFLLISIQMYMLTHVTIYFVKRYVYYFIENSGNMLHVYRINSRKMVT